MLYFRKEVFIYLVVFIGMAIWDVPDACAQKLDVINSEHSIEPLKNATQNTMQFNGYTNHWQDVYRDWYRYGGLFKMAVDDVEKNILQSKVDIAADMGYPGLLMEEGYITGLISAPFDVMDRPSITELESSLKRGNILVLVDPDSEAGKLLISKLPADYWWPERLGSYQYGAEELKKINAFCLENGSRKLFVISSKDPASRLKIKELILKTVEVVSNYDFHKGLFGVKTNIKTVGCGPGHYLDVIGKGMNEGNSWFVFNGYMDFLAKNELQRWMEEVNLPVVTDVGFSPVYGCRDYDGLQTQRMFTKESWIRFAKEKGGYIYRRVYNPAADPYHYSGYVASEGNKEQIDTEDVPFILPVRGYKASLLDDLMGGSMVLFIKKGDDFTRESMWDAINDRREVGILKKGKMLGPAYFRNALEMLLLDRVFIENYFGERLNIETDVEDYVLKVTLKNTCAQVVKGNLKLSLPVGIKVAGSSSLSLNLPAGTEKILHFELIPGLKAMNKANPIAVHYSWDGKSKSTVALFDLPPVISVHRLLFGHTPEIQYPVSVHNFTNSETFPVRVQVVSDENPEKIVFELEKMAKAGAGSAATIIFKLKVQPGNYHVKVKTLGTNYVSQLGVGQSQGNPVLTEVDLDGDGVNEYQMENDSVRVTLLTTGARVIEYIVKSRNDNVLFKKWPEKVVDEKRPNRKWNYYPYGGFEDFLGQASMETHWVFNAEILKNQGDFIRVRMWSDFYGSHIEKIFTLYGDSPLLEVRFALTFKNPEASLLGPQPIVELGDKHGTEDVFTLPEKTGWKEYRITPERRWGKIFYLTEGWHAGYDTKADVSLVGAYPVTQPLFMHMWFNEPKNRDTHHYYAEFQPWTPIYLKTTMYFTYYLWGNAGHWKNALIDLRKRNLISVK